MQKNNNNFQVNKQFADFKDKNVLIGLKNWEEFEGKIIAIDNFLNTVLERDDGLKVIKGGKVAFISIKEEEK
ncbi:LSM domain protein [Methanobrevibacter cuticularis]|uniref:LSM domain protein n=1 Tax=Methanobrevibacter cuticularis TaxID=47311 RepID=A0A166D2N6_9EURY|nr:LSM domain-containing protein [Methanobrevibacter cuticularis]KZX15146.1 LSM domain protein [Methanobrevibacter cuticularis]